MKDRDEGVSIAMETYLKYSQTVLFTDVALCWQLLVPVLGLHGGTGTIRHTYERRLLGPLMSSTLITLAQQRGTK